MAEAVDEEKFSMNRGGPSSSSSPPAYRLADLMAKVGYLMFYWGGLEHELTESIIETRTRLKCPKMDVPGSLRERLECWLELVVMLPENQHKVETAIQVWEQTLALREVRNVIAHGLQYASAMQRVGQPFITCRVGGYKDPTAETVRYTIDELERFAEGIDACRRAFKSLHAFNHRIDLPIAPT